jgi:GDP-L-fucose synthase
MRYTRLWLQASIHVMDLDQSIYDANTESMLRHIDVGTAVDCSIKELTETVAKVVEFDGEIVCDSSKPDGARRKLMNLERLAGLGWRYSIGFEEGLTGISQWFLDNETVARL